MSSSSVHREALDLRAAALPRARLVKPWQPLNPPLSGWRGRVVWLVGASSGIGRACADLLHARGATVVVSARNAQALLAFTQEHPGSHALPLDVTDVQAVHDAARDLIAAHGRLDLVVCCAGHYRAMRATVDGEAAFALDEAMRHQQVNVVGVWHVLDAVLPVLLSQGHGHLSLVASVAGYGGLPRALAYGPTKAALIHLAETLYLDLAPRGIGVSLVNPGFVDTPLTAQNEFEMPGLMTPPQAAARIVAGWEAGRFEIHFPKRFTRWLKFLRILPYRAYFWLVGRYTGA